MSTMAPDWREAMRDPQRHKFLPDVPEHPGACWWCGHGVEKHPLGCEPGGWVEAEPAEREGDE